MEKSNHRWDFLHIVFSDVDANEKMPTFYRGTVSRRPFSLKHLINWMKAAIFRIFSCSATLKGAGFGKFARKTYPNSPKRSSCYPLSCQLQWNVWNNTSSTQIWDIYMDILCNEHSMGSNWFLYASAHCALFTRHRLPPFYAKLFVVVAATCAMKS